MSFRIIGTTSGIAALAIVLIQLAAPAILGGLRGTNGGGYFWFKGEYVGWLMEKKTAWATDVTASNFGRAWDPDNAVNERRPPQIGRLAEFKAGQDGVMAGYRLVMFGLPLRMVMAEVVVELEPKFDDTGERRYDYKILGGTAAQQVQLRYMDLSWGIPVIPTRVMWMPLLGNTVLWWIAFAGAMVALCATSRAVRGSYWARDGRCRSCGYLMPDAVLRCPECGRQTVRL